jgi:hypothetical protein
MTMHIADFIRRFVFGDSGQPIPPTPPDKAQQPSTMAQFSTLGNRRGRLQFRYRSFMSRVGDGSAFRVRRITAPLNFKHCM